MKKSFFVLGMTLVTPSVYAHFGHLPTGAELTGPGLLYGLALVAVLAVFAAVRMLGKYAVAVVALLSAAPALAHHPLQGLPMATFFDGLLSGFGHPILGFDHLFFIVLLGIIAVLSRKQSAAIGTYLAAMLCGCLAVSVGVGLPATEIVIALSLLIVGAVALAGYRLGLAPMLGLFALFGLFHGAAYGTAIAGQEGGAGLAVLGGYLLGLGVIQYLIAWFSGWFTVAVWRVNNARALQPRLAGAMVAGVGLFLTLEQLEGPLLQALF